MPSLVWLGLLGKASVFILTAPSFASQHNDILVFVKLSRRHGAQEKEGLDPHGFPEYSLFSTAEATCVVWLLDSVIYQESLSCWEHVP